MFWVLRFTCGFGICLFEGFLVVLFLFDLFVVCWIVWIGVLVWFMVVYLLIT